MNQSHGVATNVVASRAPGEYDDNIRVDVTRISHKERRRSGRRHADQSNEILPDMTASHVYSQA